MFSGLPPIAEVPLLVNVSVSAINVSAYSVLHGDKRLSQNPELAMLIRIDLVTNPPPYESITHYAPIRI
jgi:hypothetical protein